MPQLAAKGKVKKLFSLLTVYCLLAMNFGSFATAQVGYSIAQPTRSAGKFFAASYGRYQIHTASNTIAGAGSILVDYGIPHVDGSVGVSDARFLPNVFPTVAPFPRLLVDQGSVQETVTPTGTASCNSTLPSNLSTGNVPICTVSGTFNNAHGANANVTSGSFGLDEAILDAQASGGGTVVLDAAWQALVNGANASAPAIIAGAPVFPNVSIEDDRNVPQYFNAGPSTTSLIATPSTLTAVTVGFGLNGANTTSGTYNGASTYHVCVAYVDISGQEGACSADFSGLTAGTGSANQIGFAAPAASTGAVGYTVYISLAAGSYALAYQVPLTSAVCKLTAVETVTPACQVANTSYGQAAGSNAIVSALTVNTSPLALQLGGVNNQLGTGNSGAHTTYAWTPSSRIGATGMLMSNFGYTASAGTIASTNPVVIATIPVSTGFMNVVGKTIRVCAKLKGTPSATTTIENLQVYWDAAGSDAAGSPVQLANINGTATYTNVVYNASFCESFVTTVSGSGVTAGSILGGANVASMGIASAPTNLVTLLDSTNAAVASLNLATGAGFSSRLHIVQNHTTGSDGAFQVLSTTVEVL